MIKKQNKYRVSIVRRDGVPMFGPNLPSPPVFKKDQDFKNFLLDKCINGEKAVLSSQLFTARVNRSRHLALQGIVEKYNKNSIAVT